MKETATKLNTPKCWWQHNGITSMCIYACKTRSFSQAFSKLRRNHCAHGSNKQQNGLRLVVCTNVLQPVTTKLQY